MDNRKFLDMDSVEDALGSIPEYKGTYSSPVPKDGSPASSISGDDEWGYSKKEVKEEPVYQCSVNEAEGVYHGIPGKVLVRGRAPRLPYKTVKELNLPEDVERSISYVADELTDFQGIVAPNFSRGSDLILISADDGTSLGRQARYFSYLPPLIKVLHEVCGSMANPEFKTCSPEAIIVVNSVNVGQDFETFLNSMLDYSSHITFNIKFLWKDIDMEWYARTPDKAIYRILPEGINILILTMEYFQNMLLTSVSSRLFQRLRFLIFEETETYFRKKKDDLIAIVKDCRNIIRNRSNKSVFQMTFSGSKWFHEMKDLYSTLNEDRHNTLLIIGALSEIIRYAKIEWNIHHLTGCSPSSQNRADELFEAKMFKLLDLLDLEVSYKRKLVISCSSDSLTELVFDSILKFSNSNFDAERAHSQLSSTDLTEAARKWSEKKVSIMVISDTVLSRFVVTDTSSLIVFDSPNKLKRNFLATQRFRSFWCNIRDLETYSPKLTTHYFLTGVEDNFYPLYRFVHTLETRVTCPEILARHYKTLELEGRANVSLCTGYKLFGFCNKPDPLLCSDRHEFTWMDFESSPVVPVEGEIEVLILKSVNPSFYRAQLLHHFEVVNGKRICRMSYVDELRRRDQVLNEYFNPNSSSHEGTPRTLLFKSKNFKNSKFRKWSWCAVVHPEDHSYCRARLETVVERDSETKKAKQVRVFCVDKGVYLHPYVNEVYELPHEFHDWPPIAVDLILCNLKPIRDELEYRRNHEKMAMSVTMRKKFHCKIWISIGSTVWVNPMVGLKVDPNTGAVQKGISVRIELINSILADFNKEHLNILINDVLRHGMLYKGHASLTASDQTSAVETVDEAKDDAESESSTETGVDEHTSAIRSGENIIVTAAANDDDADDDDDDDADAAPDDGNDIDDDEMVYLPDEWLQTVFGMLLPKHNGFKVPNIIESDTDEEVFYDAQENITPDEPEDAVPPPRRTSTSSQALGPSTSSQASGLSTSSQASRPSTSTQFGMLESTMLHCTVFWHQTKSSLILTVDLPDIKQFECQVQKDGRTITFQTLDMIKNYGFALTLFGKVSSIFETQITGRALKIILKKKTEGNIWSRVLFDKEEKHAWLKPNLQELIADTSSSDDENCDFVGLPASSKRTRGDLETGGSANMIPIEFLNVQDSFSEDSDELDEEEF